MKLSDAFCEAVREADGFQSGYDQGFEQGETCGFAKGETSGMLKIAKTMKAAGETIEKIAMYSGLSKKEIEKLSCTK